jgi:hypothetical protein
MRKKDGVGRREEVCCMCGCNIKHKTHIPFFPPFHAVLGDGRQLSQLNGFEPCTNKTHPLDGPLFYRLSGIRHLLEVQGRMTYSAPSDVHQRSRAHYDELEVVHYRLLSPPRVDSCPSPCSLLASLVVAVMFSVWQKVFGDFTFPSCRPGER